MLLSHSHYIHPARSLSQGLPILRPPHTQSVPNHDPAQAHCVPTLNGYTAGMQYVGAVADIDACRPFFLEGEYPLNSLPTHSTASRRPAGGNATPAAIVLTLLQQDLLDHPRLLTVLAHSLLCWSKDGQLAATGVWQVSAQAVDADAFFLPPGGAFEDNWIVRITSPTGGTGATVALWLPEQTLTSLQATVLPTNTFPTGKTPPISALAIVTPANDGATGVPSLHVLNAAAASWYYQHAARPPTAIVAEVIHTPLDALAFAEPFTPHAHIWCIQVGEKKPWTTMLVCWLQNSSGIASDK